MSEINLSAVKRDTGKKAAKDLRLQDVIPGVFYENGKEAINIAANKLDLRPIVYTAEAKLINLHIEGDDKPRKCVLKDFSIHPVSDHLTHFDLLGVSEDSKVTVEIPIRYVGQAIGVRDGGIFQALHHKLQVTCMPHFLPEKIEASISTLKIGESVYIKDLKIENLKIHLDENIAIATVVAPRVGGVETESSNAEPELVGQRGKKEAE